MQIVLTPSIAKFMSFLLVRSAPFFLIVLSLLPGLCNSRECMFRFVNKILLIIVTQLLFLKNFTKEFNGFFWEMGHCGLKWVPRVFFVG